MKSVEIGRDAQRKPIVIEFDEEWSGRNFAQRILRDAKLDGKTVYASSFMQEKPDTQVFPDNMIGVTFVNCNLDNCVIPPGNTVIGGSRKRWRVQNDLRDWELDANNQPVKVLSEKYWIRVGYSVNPADIPTRKLASVEEVKRAAIIDV